VWSDPKHRQGRPGLLGRERSVWIAGVVGENLVSTMSRTGRWRLVLGGLGNTPTSNRGRVNARHGKKGGARMVTLREVSGKHVRRSGHDEDTGRRLRSCDSESVSVDQATQRWRGRTEGCPEQRVTRRSLPRQQARRAPNSGGGTGAWTRRTVAELPGHACGARRVLRAASARMREEEGERVLDT
jgi:hypothetical protein